MDGPANDEAFQEAFQEASQGHASPQPPPPPPPPQPSSSPSRPPAGRPDGEKTMKKDAAHNHEQDPENLQRGPSSSSKRPSPAPAAGIHPTGPLREPSPPASDSLVSGWLDEVYPSKRPRRFSTTATSSGLENEKYKQDSHDDQYGQGNRARARARASSEPLASRDPGGDMSPAKPPTMASYLLSGSASRLRSNSLAVDSFESSTTRTNDKLVDNKDYRLNNIDSNGIQIRAMDSPLPAAVQAIVDTLGLEEPLPKPTASDIQHVKSIRARNDGFCRPIEKIICRKFDESIFPFQDLDDDASLLIRSDDMELTPALLSTKFPSEQSRKLDGIEMPRQKLSNPKPDILYGYRYEAFGPDVRYPLRTALGSFAAANTALMVMPFLVVELKGEGGGSWACTNQCIGGSVACVNIGRYLNIQLRARQQELFTGAVFSLAMNGEHATLFVTWRPDPDVDLDVNPGAEYYIQRLRHFAFQETDQYLIFQRCVRRILDWGAGKRRDAAIKAFVLCASKKRKERDEGGLPEENPGKVKRNSEQVKGNLGQAEENPDQARSEP